MPLLTLLWSNGSVFFDKLGKSNLEEVKMMNVERMNVRVWGVGMLVGVVGMTVPVYGSDCDPVEVVKLLADDAGVSDRFGFSVSISGDTAIVGAYGDTPNGFSSGSAYILSNVGGIWVQQAKLVPADGGVDQWFGHSVSISGNTAVIGAHRDDDNGPLSGSAYIYINDGGVWTQQAKLLADDGELGDDFGYTVSISGDTALIGARRDDNWTGSAYVFLRSGGVWTQEAKLLALDANMGKEFANAVSIDGDLAVVGAVADDENGNLSGAAYIFGRSGGVWTQEAKLMAHNAMEFDQFGYSVAISGSSAIVGARYENINGDRSGSAYVFIDNDGVWIQQAYLWPTDGSAGDEFGFSVDIDGDIAVMGANRHAAVGDNSGAVYVFERTGTVWPHQVKLVPSDAFAFDQFGYAVSMDGGLGLFGSHLNEDDGFQSGSAYVFDLEPDCAECPADFSGDGMLNFVDVSLFMFAVSSGNPDADMTGDGLLNFFDISAFIAAMGEGCP